ncbi:hypothetical protein [Paraburkholderia sp. BCC1885]|uniref:hypothetical protein n=1 Tax=Paraburkholderia sp. BCC1885 TaxID=2562669 RepID=UPI0011828C4C|nr:hypothetical protein [Paraburkholderia sp. BCC1885]
MPGWFRQKERYFGQTKMKPIAKALSWSEIESSHRLMTLIVLVLGLFSFFWGERITAGDGLGWDGSQYADMVRKLEAIIGTRQLGSYYAQRILPSAIVHGMLSLAGAAYSNLDIIRAFEIYNLTLLVVACGVWKRIANVVSLSLAGRWVGFSGVFLNYECSKQAFFYPVLTDVTALFTAMMLLMSYLERRSIGVFVTTVVGAFAWPVVSVCGALLLIFLQSGFPQEVVLPAWMRAKRLNVLARIVKFGGGAVLALSILGYLALIQNAASTEHECKIPKILAAVMVPSVVPCTLERLLTGLPSLTALVFALALLIGSRAFFPAIILNLRKAPLHLIVMAIAAIVVPSVVVKAISNPFISNPSNVQYLIEFILLPPSGKVLLPFVTLSAFWGPLVLLLCLFWKECCVEARRLGPGVVAVLGASIPLGIACEPRFITVAWPFFVLVLVLALERSKATTALKCALAVLTIVFGQFWLQINIMQWLPPDYGGILTFPKQLYFMHYGLWMSWMSYLLQLPVVVLSAIWLRRTLSKFNAAHEESPRT